MKIAHLLATGGWGGAERLACALAERAAQHGHVVSVDAAPLAQAGLARAGFLGGGHETKLANWASAAHGRLLKSAPDLVHVHLSTPAFAATALLAARGFNSLVTLHLLPEKSWPKDFLWRVPCSLTLLAGARFSPRWQLVAVSQSDQLRLRPWFGSGVRLVSNAPRALAEDESDDSDHAFQGASLKILSVGRLEAQKGIDRLLTALAAPALAALNFRLLLIGDGEKRSELMQLAKRLGLGEQVRFLAGSPWQRAARAADLLICPSRYEGMPLVPMEGVLAGCPVVASPIPAHREQFGTVLGSLLPAQERAWPEFLLALLADPERRARLGEAQRSLVPLFSFNRMWDGYQRLYDELTQGKAVRAASSGSQRLESQLQQPATDESERHTA